MLACFANRGKDRSKLLCFDEPFLALDRSQNTGAVQRKLKSDEHGIGI